jgi:methionyl-tRNA formyltransferase
VLKVVFFGNSEGVFSNRYLQAFAESPCQIVGVVDVPPARRTSTNTRSSVGTTDFVATAHQRDIPAFEPSSPNQPGFVQAMHTLEPDLFVAVGYMNVLKEPILSVPRLLTVNFHASLLPAYRGKHPVFWALRNGERWSGMTVHAVDRGLDTGDILYQVKVRTRRNDTVASLYDRIMERSIWLPARLVEDARRGQLHPRPQPEEGASYYSLVGAEDFRLDWSLPAERLRRMIVTSPGQCFCDVAGHRIFFLDAEVVAAPDESPPGTLVAVRRGSGVIRAGDAGLWVRRMKVDGAAVQTMSEVCQALGLRSGARFGGAKLQVTLVA